MKEVRFPEPSGRIFALLLLVISASALIACADEVSFQTEMASETDTATPEPGRLLPLSSTRNARDLGGYKTDDGRTVKWGVLYRSDGLADLTDTDLAYLKTLHLAAITDFRSDRERAAAPDRLPQQSPVIAYKTAGINNPAMDAAVLGKKIFSGQLSQADLEALTDRSGYINDLEVSRMWGQWVRELAEPGALPHLFHCTAGKDRTGFAAAIVLLTLGVPREKVMEDFLLSNYYLGDRIEENVERIQELSSAEIDPAVLRGVLGVTPISLDSAIAAMEAKYGSVDAFIEQGLGIDASTRLRLETVLLE